MARYIDADELYRETEKKIKANHECRMAVVDDEFLDLINDAFTEDVVPRSEVAVEAVQMVALEEANRGLRIQLEIAKSEVERLQAEIERLTINMNAYGLAAKRLSELKKKYTEGE